MEQQRATAFGERQIAEFIENHRVDLGQAACARSGFAELLFLLQLIDEIDDVIEPDPVPGLDGGHAEGNGEMGFAGAGATDQNQIVSGGGERGGGQLPEARFRERRFGEVEMRQIPVHGEAGHLQLIAQGAHLPIGFFGLDQALEPVFRETRLAILFG